jgi:hypothetical protein
MILYATELYRVEGSCYECIFALIFIIIGFASFIAQNIIKVIGAKFLIFKIIILL